MQLTLFHLSKVPEHAAAKMPWEVVGVDIFMINNEQLLCIVNYYSKFLVINK